MTEEHISKTDLLKRIDAGWNKLQSYIAGLSEAQLTQPTDAAGWTVKDHLFHLSVWEDSMAEMLQGRPRWERMEQPPASASTHDFDAQNAVIQQANKNKTVAEVKQALTDAHENMQRALQSLSDDDLYLNYNSYLPDPSRDTPVINWVIGDTYEHYDEHIPWMDAIVKGSPA
jgi:uncharacterized protein (TIGR03083 family)